MTKIANVENVVCSVETMSRHPELYHYTNALAFESIIQSRSLWCSHYRHMTDRNNKDLQEIRLMRDMLPPAISPRMDEITKGLNRNGRRAWKASGGGDKVARDLVSALYKATFDSMADYSTLDAYLFSFSTHAGDTGFDREHGIRSQWDGYAGAEGFCFVFDIAEIARMLGREMDARYWVRLSLDPVRYADQPVDVLFPELVNASAETLRKFIDGERFPEMAVPEFLAGTTLLKDASFRAEREIRIVAIPGTAKAASHAAKEYPKEFDPCVPLPAIRTRPNSNKRYIALFEGMNESLPIKRVIVGPGREMEQRTARAMELLGQKIRVTPSLCKLD